MFNEYESNTKILFTKDLITNECSLQGVLFSNSAITFVVTEDKRKSVQPAFISHIHGPVATINLVKNNSCLHLR